MASIISAGTSSGTALNMTGDTSGQLQLATGASATTAVTIDTSQNVGIGTTSPANKLDVTGIININNGSYGISIPPNSQGGFGLQLRGDTNASSRNWQILSNTSAYGLLDFQVSSTNAASGFTSKMVIDSSGNLLVGTTSARGIITTNFSAASVTGVDLLDTANQSGAYFNVFRNSAGTVIGSVTRNAATNAVLYNTTSDYRLKENVTPLANAIDKVLQLKPVQWVWKDCDGQTGEGFIAHEVQEVIPSAVNGVKDALDSEGNPIYQGMDASYLVATLTAAIQEQQTIINDLKARIETLEAK